MIEYTYLRCDPAYPGAQIKVSFYLYHFVFQSLNHFGLLTQVIHKIGRQVIQMQNSQYEL